MTHVDLATIAAARAAGRLDDPTFARALEVLAESPPRPVWVELLDRAALVLGAALGVVGVVFLVAWNWAELGYGTKLLLAAGAMLGTGGTGLRLGVGTRAGDVALASSAWLAGPLLVVYSQAYQTGADPWELFATWMVLVVPFALATRASALWLLALVLAEVGLAAWAIDNVVTDEKAACWLALALAGTNAAALAGWELRARGPALPTGGRLFPRVAVVAAFVLALAPATLAVLGLDEAPAVAWLGYGVVVAGVGVVQLAYWGQDRDAFVIAASLAAAITLATSTLARLVLETEPDKLVVTGVVGLALLGETVASVWWVREGRRRETGGRGGER